MNTELDALIDDRLRTLGGSPLYYEFYDYFLSQKESKFGYVVQMDAAYKGAESFVTFTFRRFQKPRPTRLLIKREDTYVTLPDDKNESLTQQALLEALADKLGYDLVKRIW